MGTGMVLMMGWELERLRGVVPRPPVPQDGVSPRRAFDHAGGVIGNREGSGHSASRQASESMCSPARRKIVIIRRRQQEATDRIRRDIAEQVRRFLMLADAREQGRKQHAIRDELRGEFMGSGGPLV